MPGSPYDFAQHLRTSEEMAAYLEACFEEANGDATLISKALNDVARAKKLFPVADTTDLTGKNEYLPFCDERCPGFDKNSR